MSATESPAVLRPFELACPDLSAERAGNTDTVGVWHFDSGAPGKRVMLTALIHGNELCGAWALKTFLASGLRPRRGSLTLAFCNLAAFDRFDPKSYIASRFVDEDMNRVWSDDKLSDPSSQERRRAAELLPWLKQADWLLDFHSMSNSDVPLQLTGVQPRNIEFALQLGTPANIIADAGHAAGVRMRDYGRFGEAGENGTRSLLIECGFHGAPEARDVALDQMARFLIAADTMDREDIPAAWFAPDAPAQEALRVTEAIAAKSANVRFAQPWRGLEKLPQAGTLLGWNDEEPFYTPYDNCVLIMPSLANVRPGVTVMRLAQPIG
ncbi:succinylglutamate desuccinylase/aspartoacylase domain-containing protein [Bordetella sp. 02P26C-1]|uniref:succinylglutamate desuccinylase/aspartoacylase domain-containing protein n=1 Tax=Bordetella sp. 02P26C-1 TaxID=2683195 RepID=UPI001355E18C|nr:succinylglutamate desuccinylase/aspartoacylase family protein [Bordetella sp. 02P26C-1]MVW78551.1 succinylglutamate desuccinylase [Bordetella sp. 02P26C-1]